MCGINGIFDHKNSNSFSEDIIKMNASLQHRGPDNTDFYVDDNVVLGHTRLSIIDLSSSGNQPMQIGNMVITFNGEIYNYIELRKELESKGVIFKTQSDTEVLLQAYRQWGKECLPKLNGMFAFAIWDKEKEELFCARDRFGIKPLYFYHSGSRFIFSSEIKSILSVIEDVCPNNEVLQRYLLYGDYGSPCRTFFKNIHALNPASWTRISRYGSECNFSYWNLDTDVEKFKDNEEDEAMEQYLELMSDSIRLRLRSDVQIGLNVSGGLDSSALLGAIDYYYGHDTKFNVYTYTCGDERYDEVPYVKQLLEGTDHAWKQCLLTESEFYDSLNEMQWYFDEPFGGLPTLAYSRIFKQAREDGVKVLLAGEGMDEQWGGYDYYLGALNEKPIGEISVVQNTNTPTMDVLNDDFKQGYEIINYPQPFKNNIDNLKYRDFMYTKIPRSLRFLDRISMASSTEVRVPFLDHRLVELSFRMPNHFLIKDGVRKYLLRQIVEKMLPSTIVKCPKRPLQTPHREWLKKAEWVEDILYSSSFRNRGIFDMKGVHLLYNDYKNGKFDNAFFLWQWVNLEVWFRTFID